MKLIVAGSGSSGNCYLLVCQDSAMVLDAGVRFLEAKKALNFNIRMIKGVLITHEHGDHHAFAHEYEAAGIPVWKPYAMESPRQTRRFGSFTIHSFDCVHNVPCVGYLIEHPACGRVLYVSDTEYVKYRFKGLRTMIIEANYHKANLGRYEANREHVLRGHMSIETACECIKANDNPELKTVVLCHLSDGHSNEAEFISAAQNAVNPWCRVYAASAGMEIEL